MRLFAIMELKKDEEIIMRAVVEEPGVIGDGVFIVKKDKTLFKLSYKEFYEQLKKNGYIDIED
jgi:hypothetical protein